MTRRPFLKIPLNKIAEGADLCLENASQFCSDARILNEKSSHEHALGLSILAVEELGKAIMLTEQAAYAAKRTEDVVSFEKVEPQIFFNAPLEFLKGKGFSGDKINPFYDHLSKLLYSKNIRNLATWTRIMKSVNGKEFQTMDEIDRIIELLWKQAKEIDIEKTDLRELAFYVDYDPQKREWHKGRIKITSEKMKEFIIEIEIAINLIREWKVATLRQKSISDACAFCPE